MASDSTDEYPADNVAQQAIEVVELQYGRDNGEFVGQTPADGTVDFIAGVPYDAVNDMTIYASTLPSWTVLTWAQKWFVTSLTGSSGTTVAVSTTAC